MSQLSQAMTKIRKKIRDTVGVSNVSESFFTHDRDTNQIVSNQKIGSYHFIFDMDGNLIKQHNDQYNR